MEIMEPYDVVIDGTDNFPVRYLVNDATQFLGKPLVYGSIYQFEGQATVFLPGPETPCYRCLFPSPPPPGTVPSCAEGGVFGVLPGVVGAIQATEAIKLITGEGDTLVGRLLLYDALHMDFQEVKIRWDADCPVCGKEPTITELIDYEEFCGVPRGPVIHEGENERHGRDREAPHHPAQARRRRGEGRRRRRHPARRPGRTSRPATPASRRTCWPTTAVCTASSTST